MMHHYQGKAMAEDVKGKPLRGFDCQQWVRLLIMYKSSFHLQGWDTEEIAPPLSHRLQLQPLQEIIAKARDCSPKAAPPKKLPAFSTTNFPLKSQDLFHSTNVSRKKIRTQPERRQLKPPNIPAKLLIEQTHQSQPQQAFLKKTQPNSAFFKSIVTFIEKQPTAIKKSPRFVLQNKKQQQIYFPKNRRHSKSLNLLFKKQPLKTREKFETISKFKANLKTEEVATKCETIEKDESLTKLKRFFLQTIQGIEGRKQDQKEKYHQVKLKNMLEKSNRKKKEIEELFKTRLFVGRNGHERKAKARLERMLLQPEERARHKSRNRLFGNQFDDDGLFCPWSYKDEKVIGYMKSKHYQ